MIYVGFKFTELIRLAYGVLDWGLGHASRSVPVIKALIDKGIKPLIVCGGPSEDYLKSVFPFLEFETLPKSDIVYKLDKPVWQSVLSQMPQLKNWNQEAHERAKRLHSLGYRHFISDNVYGFHVSGARNALITHQTSPALPIRIPGLDWVSAYRMRPLLRPFQSIWIPILSEFQHLIRPLTRNFHPNVVNIGWLTSFKPTHRPENESWLVVLSGPEDYRTELEHQLLNNWPKHIKADFVRGTNNPLSADIQIPEKVIMHNKLNPFQLEPLWSKASFLVARSGFSTVMDAWCSNRPAIWIPTPGQTEQEILAQSLEKEHKGISLQQDKISNLKDSMLRLTQLNFQVTREDSLSPKLLEDAINRFLNA